MKQLIIFVVLCLPLLYSCGAPQQQETDTAYKTLTIKSGDQILKTGYTATLRGRQNVEIRPQVSGIITEICINEGDAVHKGQTLFIIDQIPYKAALQTAIANVKSAEAKLATAKLTADSKAELYKEQVVSEFDLQTARNEQIAAEAALAQAKAQEVNARNDLSYTEVKSPVDGVASMIPYRVGALVNSSITEPLVTVSDDSEVYAYFSMTENQILDFVQQYGSLKKAIEHLDKVELTMSNGKTYSSLGKVDAISGTIDEGTGAISLRAVFSNPDQFLRNGGSGTVVVPTVKKQCIIIPQAATYELQNRIFVYKVVDSKAQSAPVEVFRLNNGTEYVVEDGLASGDVIIAEGAGLVREGTIIKSGSTKE
ncbi:efflux RND transporter periplasmic adaptor subunit [Bacteroides thetaiotaomicron]|jgi:efflux transporter, RND family, MFP subunit|uniref:efflux RND transporter periplasmic adaptor subunit n=1 Tax=Bacteroides thetaiotaomicron TaxID=818 RepID=UPI001F381FA5|nr:efflux RND transporter periplasmic adaptor subunit [Bacteroides thetaiotaomicron]MCE8734532.1 efflux RND transporter periplasmic adaptor subunit [Bacteroides thetaiotaomicron]